MSFTISAHTGLQDGIRYKIYAISGDEEENKERLLDDVMSLEFTPPANGNGFTTMINNYNIAKSPNFENGRVLISTGLVKNTSSLTTKTYNLKLWIDSSKIYISSSTKREINAEDNPSLADATSGNITATRYMKNDENNPSTVTLYPANSDQVGKIVYTTNEFSKGYYSIKILVEAEDVKEDEVLVYLDANGGEISTDYKMLNVGDTYGNLPMPQRDGYTFLGWNGKNMFSPLNKEIGFNNTTGAEISDATSATTDFIEVDFTNNNYYFLTLSNDYRTMVGAYNENFEFLGRRSGGRYSTLSISKNSFTTDKTSATGIAKYIKVKLYEYSGLSGQISNVDSLNLQLEPGNSATAYEPYLLETTTEITQTKDHVLKAIWQKNGN